MVTGLVAAALATAMVIAPLGALVVVTADVLAGARGSRLGRRLSSFVPRMGRWLPASVRDSSVAPTGGGATDPDNWRRDFEGVRHSDVIPDDWEKLSTIAARLRRRSGPNGALSRS